MRRLITFSFLLAAASTMATASAAETWRVDPGHSSATFTVRHLVFAIVRGSVPIREGGLVTDGSTLPVSVSATLDAAKIESGNDKRDSDLRGPDWLETDKYPTISFKSTKVIPGADASSFSVVGDLTIHGVTKSVTLSCKYLGGTGGQGRRHAGYEATTTIDRRDFGLNWARQTPGGELIAGNDVQLTLDVEAVSGS
jgi:polyisoprenoid-binding protein YceI